MEAVFIHDYPNQLFCCRAFIQLHGVELVGNGLKVFDGVGALLTERLQAQVKGHRGSTGQDPLEFINQVIGVHEGKTTHEHVDPATAAFNSRHFHCDRIISTVRPTGTETAAGIITPLLPGKIVGRGGGTLVEPIVNPGSGCITGKHQCRYDRGDKYFSLHSVSPWKSMVCYLLFSRGVTW